MLEFTRFLREESSKDIYSIYHHNNSKAARRTSEQNEQARSDKQKHFTNKWKELLAKCTTNAQKDYCYNVLNRIHCIR